MEFFEKNLPKEEKEWPVVLSWNLIYIALRHVETVIFIRFPSTKKLFLFDRKDKRSV